MKKIGKGKTYIDKINTLLLYILVISIKQNHLFLKHKWLYFLVLSVQVSFVE